LLSETATKTTVKITRSQMPIQPAFAITGHSAEGKTLNSVLCNLWDGGFGAYVAASRACSRHGLYIMQPVSIQDLNKPMPYSLLQETKRLQTIEHNMYICYGFIRAQYRVIPDPESKTNMDKTSFIPIFNIISNTQSKKNKWR
jgi:hypothetical protein